MEALRFAQGKLCRSIFQLLLLVSTCMYMAGDDLLVRAIRVSPASPQDVPEEYDGAGNFSGLALLHTHYGTELHRNKVLHAFVRSKESKDSFAKVIHLNSRVQSQFIHKHSNHHILIFGLSSSKQPSVFINFLSGSIFLVHTQK